MSFWFWPSPSAPVPCRTPGGTCTRTSSPAPASAPYPPHPKAADSLPASYSHAEVGDRGRKDDRNKWDIQGQWGEREMRQDKIKKPKLNSVMTAYVTVFSCLTFTNTCAKTNNIKKSNIASILWSHYAKVTVNNTNIQYGENNNNAKSD